MKNRFASMVSEVFFINNAPRLGILSLLILMNACTPLDKRSKENPANPATPPKSSQNKNPDSNSIGSGPETSPMGQTSPDNSSKVENPESERVREKLEIQVEDSNPPSTTEERPVEPITIDDGKTVLLRGPLKMENAIVTFDPEIEQITLKGHIQFSTPNKPNGETLSIPNAILVGSVRETGVANLYPDQMTLKLLPDNFLLVAQAICFGNQRPYEKSLHNCQNIQINLYAKMDKDSYTTTLDSQKVTELTQPEIPNSNPPQKPELPQDNKPVAPDAKENKDNLSPDKSKDSKGSPASSPKAEDKDKDKDKDKISQEDFLMLIEKGIVPPLETNDDKKGNAKDPLAKEEEEEEEDVDPSAPITDTTISKDSIDFLESEFMFARKQGLAVAEVKKKSVPTAPSNGKGSASQKSKCEGDPICFAKEKKRPYNQAFFFPQNGKMQDSTSLVTLAKNKNGNVPFMILRPQRGNYYGTFDLVKTVEALGAEVQKSLPGYKIMVRDMSKARGGSFGHKSHTNGTDMDVAFIRKNGNKTPDFVTVADSHRITDPAFDVATQWKAFYFLANDPRVHLNVIYLAPAIKQKMCEYTSAMRKKAKPDELQKINKTLKALRSRSRKSGKEIAGHRNHFHVRLLCSKFDIGSRCRNYDTPDTTTGCRN